MLPPLRCCVRFATQRSRGCPLCRRGRRGAVPQHPCLLLPVVRLAELCVGADSCAQPPSLSLPLTSIAESAPLLAAPACNRYGNPEHNGRWQHWDHEGAAQSAAMRPAPAGFALAPSLCSPPSVCLPRCTLPQVSCPLLHAVPPPATQCSPTGPPRSAPSTHRLAPASAPRQSCTAPSIPCKHGSPTPPASCEPGPLCLVPWLPVPVLRLRRPCGSYAAAQSRRQGVEESRHPCSALDAACRAGPYSSSDPALLRRHFRELRATGVGVAAVSWWGPGWRQNTTDTQVGAAPQRGCLLGAPQRQSGGGCAIARLHAWHTCCCCR